MPSLSVSPLWVSEWVLGLLAVQVPMTAVLLARLIPGLRRRPPLDPVPSKPAWMGQVSVIVPTLNEADRIGSCLAGLQQQGPEVAEIVVVDSRSTDETVAQVEAAAEVDPRFRVEFDDPLPTGWVGRPWALHTGYLRSSSGTEWILDMDADTAPQPGLVAALLQVSEQEQWDLITLAPQFILEYPGESWIQPALLTTLIYRFGAVGPGSGSPDRVMANGQCLWVKKSVLDAVGGHSCSRLSFCDDVTLVRVIAAAGYRVGFLDGSRLVRVRMYTSFGETWREWGRSLDLKDASPPGQVWGDCLFLLAVQGIPLYIVLILLASQVWSWGSPLAWGLLGLNSFLLTLRLAVLIGIQGSYLQRSWTFWLSPLADPLAVLRILLSAGSRPQMWRGRNYQDL